MKKTVNINLNGSVFFIDEDAFVRLRTYLDKLESYFNRQPEGEEIIRDIESRIAELFLEKLSGKSSVVTIDMVKEVITQMGQPEDFEANSINEEKFYRENASSKSKKRLYRDIDNRVIAGVCAGIAAYLNADPVLIRILFAVLPLLSLGIVIPIYIILWIVVPAALTTAQKLEMRGENVTIKNIEKSIRKEYEEVKEHFNKVKQSKAYQKSESWWQKLTKRDKNLIIAIAIVGGVVLLGHLIKSDIFTLHYFQQVGHPLGHFLFFDLVGMLILVALLLIIGFLFKTAFKIIIYLIAFLFIGMAVLTVLSFLFGGLIAIC
jgi:phage shock protein PspC (stress-responsive transcriptional regulator)